MPLPSSKKLTSQLLCAGDSSTAKYVRYNDTTCYDYLSFKYTWTKKEIGEDDVWCARSYLVYRDEAGEEHTVYGELVRANLSGIINE